MRHTNCTGKNFWEAKNNFSIETTGPKSPYFLDHILKLNVSSHTLTPKSAVHMGKNRFSHFYIPVSSCEKYDQNFAYNFFYIASKRLSMILCKVNFRKFHSNRCTYCCNKKF